jgi:pentatricopeptide repeat protein
VVLRAWSKFSRGGGEGYATKRAVRLLDRMEALAGESVSESERRWRGVSADVISYATVAQCYGRSRFVRLESLKGLYRRMINSDLVLDSTVFNVILNVTAKKITASRRSEECVAFMAEVLDDMKSNGIEMDNYTLNTALEIYHKCGKDGDEMLKLLQEMDVSASLISYNIILKNLCQQDRMEEAHTFLQNMVTNYIKDNQSIKPTVATFNSRLNYDHDPLTTCIHYVTVLTNLIQPLALYSY